MSGCVILSSLRSYGVHASLCHNYLYSGEGMRGMGRIHGKETTKEQSYFTSLGPRWMMYTAMFLNMAHIFGKKNSNAPISSTLFLFWEEKQHEEQSVGRRGMWSVRNKQGHSASRKKKETYTKTNKSYALKRDLRFKVEAGYWHFSKHFTRQYCFPLSLNCE